MPRPYGVPNLQIPDPPFIVKFGKKATCILSPHQIEVERTAEDGSIHTELQWEFDVKFEHTNVSGETITLDDVQDLEILFKLINRWATKMEKDKEKLQSQLEELQKKLDFLKR